jgi:hypothetical protein
VGGLQGWSALLEKIPQECQDIFLNDFLKPMETRLRTLRRGKRIDANNFIALPNLRAIRTSFCGRPDQSIRHDCRVIVTTSLSWLQDSLCRGSCVSCGSVGLAGDTPATTKKARNSRVPVSPIANNFFYPSGGVGRGCGVPRGLGVGIGLPGVGVTVTVGVGVTVTVGVGVAPPHNPEIVML